MVKEVVGFEGDIRFRTDMPDGMPRKVLDTGRLSAMGWTPSIDLKEGLASTYEWYLQNERIIRRG